MPLWMEKANEYFPLDTVSSKQLCIACSKREIFVSIPVLNR